MATVVITQQQAIPEAIAEAMAHISLGPLVRDKRVVKPNETWASPEDTTGVTQPDALRAVLQQVKQFGPRELIVSGGAGAAETEDVFRLAGLMAVVEQEGATFFDHNRPPFTAEERLRSHKILRDTAGTVKPSSITDHSRPFTTPVEWVLPRGKEAFIHEFSVRRVELLLHQRERLMSGNEKK